MTDVQCLFFEKFFYLRNETLWDIREAKENGRQYWRVVSFSKLRTVWERRVRDGFVRYPKFLYEIAGVFLNNIVQLVVNTELCGHTPNFPDDEVDDILQVKGGYEQFWAYMEKRGLYEYFLDERAGQDRISDYAIEPLTKLWFEIKEAEDDESLLVSLDRVLNVVHQRSDLASWFVEGGSENLLKLSS